MAKILLLSIHDLNAEGLRLLSALLKNRGHQPFLVFLKRYGEFTYRRAEASEDDWVGIDSAGREFRYASGSPITAHEKQLLLELIQEIAPQLIGISVTTPLRAKAAEISLWVKDFFKIPVIWGGPEATLNPEACLDYCDFTCVGEGEKTMTEIASALDEKKELGGIQNLAYRSGGRFVQNPLHPLVADLDTLPFKDIDPGNKFLIENDLLTENFGEVTYANRDARYHLMTSRGCLFHCSYCCEDFYKSLYASQSFLRRRSVGHVLDELKTARKTLDFRQIIFEDEFFSHDPAWLEEFGDRYRREIQLPFMGYIFPNKNIRMQLRILKEAGLTRTCLGLQSGSDRINREVFGRPFDRNLYLETANLLKTMGIEYYVDIITFNPFENEEDLEATLEILTELPKPFDLCVNKLYAVKGTKIRGLLRASGKSLPSRPESKRLFQAYSRLFWLAKKYPKTFVLILHRCGRFCRHLIGATRSKLGLGLDWLSGTKRTSEK